MRTLAYISRACAPLNFRALGDLLDDARSFNAAQQLTGVLLHAHGMFLQLLEGKPEALDAAMQRIRASKKHEDLIVVFDEAITARLFPAWAMGWPGNVTADAAVKAVVGAAAAPSAGTTPGQQDMLRVIRTFLADETPAAGRGERALSSGAA